MTDLVRLVLLLVCKESRTFIRWTSQAPLQTTNVHSLRAKVGELEKRSYGLHCPHNLWAKWAKIDFWINAYIILSVWDCNCSYICQLLNWGPGSHVNFQVNFFPGVRLSVSGLCCCFCLEVNTMHFVSQKWIAILTRPLKHFFVTFLEEN